MIFRSQYNPNPEADFNTAQNPDNGASNNANNGANNANANNNSNGQVDGDKIVNTAKEPMVALRAGCWLIALITWALITNSTGAVAFWFATFLIAWLYLFAMIFLSFLRVCVSGLAIPAIYVFIADGFILCFTAAGFIVGVIWLAANSVSSARAVVTAIFSCLFFIAHGFLTLNSYKATKPYNG